MIYTPLAAAITWKWTCVSCSNSQLGRVKRKRAFERAQSAQSDHHAHAQNIIRAFALNSYIL